MYITCYLFVKQRIASSVSIYIMCVSACLSHGVGASQISSILLLLCFVRFYLFLEVWKSPFVLASNWDTDWLVLKTFNLKAKNVSVCY